MLQFLPDGAAGDEPGADLSRARAMVSDLTRRVRDLSLDLRPIMLDDLGLVPTLLWYCRRYSLETRIDVELLV